MRHADEASSSSRPTPDSGLWSYLDFQRQDRRIPDLADDELNGVQTGRRCDEWFVEDDAARPANVVRPGVRRERHQPDVLELLAVDEVSYELRQVRDDVVYIKTIMRHWPSLFPACFLTCACARENVAIGIKLAPAVYRQVR
jgi:hypothetical protein